MSVSRGETVTILEVKGTKPGFEEFVWVEQIVTKAENVKFAVFMKDETGEDTLMGRYNDHATAVGIAANFAIDRTAICVGVANE